MVSFLAGHRPYDGHVVRQLRQARQVFADAYALDVGSDGLEEAAVVVLRLGIECVYLAWAAGHPQQNTGALSFLVFSGGHRERRKPSAHAEESRTGQAQPTSTVQE
jgi:hypothetical protein